MSQISLEIVSAFCNLVNELICDDCGLKLTCLRSFYKHRKIHQCMRRKSNAICPNPFSSAFRLKIERPKRRIGVRVLYKCEFCPKIFGTKQQFIHHRYVHTGEKPYECCYCQKSFAHPSGLRRHLKTHPEEDETRFQCKECGRKFAEKKYLTYHMAIHTGEKPYACEVCDKKFVRPHDFRRHMELHQRTTKKPFQCDVCFKNFSTKTYLNIHMRLHSEGQNYECDKCGHKFTHKQIYDQHVERHLNNGFGPNHPCHLCSRKFFSEKYLKYHLLKHAGGGEHECSFCQKRFGRLTDLNKHTRMHTNPPPCFKCEGCSLEFNDRRKYRAHYASKHMKHTCDICKKDFNSAKYVRLHKLTHTGEQPHKCIHCSKKFIRGDLLKKHLKNSHPKAGASDKHC